MIPRPFPHLVSTDLFDRKLLTCVADELPDQAHAGWRRYRNEHEAKLEGPPALWGPSTVRYFADLEQAIPTFEGAFGLAGLTLETIGGGYHLIPPGGYLDVHTDFSKSPRTGHYRRVNVLTFLNPLWAPDDGGHLELWNDEHCVVSIAPEFGTTVAFVTSTTSWHGHPAPTKRWRASVAGYLFTEDPPVGFVDQSTVWHPNGGRRA